MPKSLQQVNELEKAIKAIDDKVVQSQQYSAASAALDEMLAFAGVKSKGMMLFGDSGLGKTTVLTKFVTRNHDALVARAQKSLCYPVDVVPIVRINMDARPTVKSVCQAILREAGQTDCKGTAAELADRIETLIYERHLQVLAVDECQHLLKKNAGAHASSVLNFLKNLMREENKLVVIFAGMPHAEQALDDHAEIRRRLSYKKCHIRPFSIDTEKELDNFASLLSAFDQLMPTLCKWNVTMCSKEMVKPIFFASNGNPSYFKDLLMKVTVRGLQSDQPVTKNDFAAAYADEPLNQLLGKLNPFKAEISVVMKTLQGALQEANDNGSKKGKK